MTVREVARAMTFPRRLVAIPDPGASRCCQLGNAVPVHFGEVMTGAVAAALHPTLHPTHRTGAHPDATSDTLARAPVDLS